MSCPPDISCHWQGEARLSKIAWLQIIHFPLLWSSQLVVLKYVWCIRVLWFVRLQLLAKFSWMIKREWVDKHPKVKWNIFVRIHSCSLIGTWVRAAAMNIQSKRSRVVKRRVKLCEIWEWAGNVEHSLVWRGVGGIESVGTVLLLSMLWACCVVATILTINKSPVSYLCLQFFATVYTSSRHNKWCKTLVSSNVGVCMVKRYCRDIFIVCRYCMFHCEWGRGLMWRVHIKSNIMIWPQLTTIKIDDFVCESASSVLSNDNEYDFLVSMLSQSMRFKLNIKE